MSLWDHIQGWFTSNARQLVTARIEDPEGGEPMVPDETYFGLWLTHGFLDRDRNWFTRRYPTVHVSARLDVAGTTRTLTKLAGPQEGNLGPGVWTDFPVTGLTPYRGGVIEVEAGLSALETSSYLGAAVDVLSDFSGLIAPPLSEAMTIAGKVSDGVQRVLEEGGEQIELGLHQAFTAPGGGGDRQLEPGYLAVVKATEEELDPAALRVRESRLHLQRDGGLVPLEGFDYILIRIEGRKVRDDWRFERFDALIGKAIDAHFAGEAEKFAGYRNSLLAEILKSPDLTRPDRNRIADAALAEIKEATDHGPLAVGGAPITIARIAKRAAPIDDPIASVDVALPELLARHQVG